MREELLEAWRTNNRINLFLLEKIPEEAMGDTLSTRGGRSVARQFAHLHNQRIYALENRARDLAQGLVKFESRYEPPREELAAAFRASGKAIGTFLGDVMEGVPKRRGFKRGIFTTLSYFIAHESHHRGSILLTIKGCGHRMENFDANAIWGWDRI